MMTNDEKERYARQIILTGFGNDGQSKLSDARVLVIGAGGLGCPALQYLVAAGVGTIGIADADVVSLSNLHRQILYTVDDIGQYKVAIAAKKLARLNPTVNIITHQISVQNTNALNLIEQYDWILDGTDNFASRYLINDACVLLKKVLIFGAVSQFQGQVAIFNAADNLGVSTNYRDVFSIPPKAGEVLNCAEAGVLGVLPGIIGTMQAAELIKLITGIGKPLINKLLTYNVLNNDIYELDILPALLSKNTQPLSKAQFLQMNYADFCNIKEPVITEIDVDKFKTISLNPSTIVIDVREIGELPLITSIKHRQIPMTIFKESMKDISEQSIILFCQHGIRSIYAGEMLQEFFGGSKNLYSLKGGVSRWAEKLL